MAWLLLLKNVHVALMIVDGMVEKPGNVGEGR